jgi:hypothetical protein
MAPKIARCATYFAADLLRGIERCSRRVSTLWSSVIVRCNLIRHRWFNAIGTDPGGPRFCAAERANKPMRKFSHAPA